MEADREWERWREWLGAEPSGNTIYARVVELLAFRSIWRGFAIVHDEAPAAARKYGTFLVWVRRNYARSMGSAIRSQADTREDVVSLARLIDRIWRFPTALNRARYRLVITDPESDAEAWFTELAGRGDFINPEILAEDMDRLLTRTRQVRQWVNKSVAHQGVREPEPPPIDEIHSAIDVIFEIFSRYMALLRGVTVHRGVSMPPWYAIFRETWIPDDEHWHSIAKRVGEATDS